MNVRWVDGLSAADRAEVERLHGLRAGGVIDDDGRTWRYDLGDVSASNGLSLIRHPLVEDTAGLDRETGQILSGWADAVSRPAPLPGGDSDRSLLLDRSDCTVEGTVDIAATDGIGDLRLIAVASEPALLFFSEPYYPERRVWVDGAERPLERVNVAFSGVWVDAGTPCGRVAIRAVQFSLGSGDLGLDSPVLARSQSLDARSPFRPEPIRPGRFDPMNESDPTDEVMAAVRTATEAWETHLASRRATPVYQAYERVRRQVLGLRALGRNRRLTGHEPSDYWTGELAKFEYMLDASPLIIDSLRQHTQNLTGLHPNHYRQTLHKHRRRFAEKLEALRALDDADLWVPESRLLGGFGFDIEGALVNIDTLKFYEVLIAMQLGAVLPEMRQTAERKLVWEIGSGWGGFPYQFKKLCPNVTYVITDFPELFLFSATYLMAAFPEAKVRFYGEVPPQETFSDWRNLDFIFLPDTFHAAARPEQVDLLINMVSFQEMTTQQVTAYVRRAFELECPYLYSLNRDRSGHNPELSNVRSIVGQYYWPHEIDVLPVSYTKMLHEDPDEDDSGYKHVVGWRRVSESEQDQ